MAQAIEAVYERGTFRVFDAVPLPEGQRVALSYEPLAMTPAEAEAYVREWQSLYEGQSEQEIADIEAVILDRSSFSRPLN